VVVYHGLTFGKLKEVDMGDKTTPAHKSKVQSKSSPKFTDPGSSGRMSSQNSAGPQIPGQSASMGRGGGNFVKGGPSGRMSGKNTAKNATPA
jgi:hypothetical protein